MRKFKPYAIAPRICQMIAWVPTRLLLTFFCRFEIRGSKNLAGIDQAIFAVNHASELDPIILTAALNPLGRFAPMFYITAPLTSFADPHFGWRRYLYSSTWFFKAWGAYPHIPGFKDYSKSLRQHIEILKDGYSICIFPEGAVTKTGALGEARGGVAYLAHDSKAPIVPVAISGTFKMNMSGFLRGKRKIIIEFGKPILAHDFLPKILQNDTDERYRRGSEHVFQPVFDMLESHRAVSYKIPWHVAFSYTCIRTLLGPFVRRIWVARVTGIENLPKTGAALIAATHESYFDFICTIAIARRNVYYLAAEKFFKNPLWRPLMRATGQIEVDREHKENRTHIDAVVLDLLSQGLAVGIFPEGTRSSSPTEMMRGYPGVVRYAFESGAPIIPIGIKGAFQVMSRFDSKPKFKRIIELHIGTPFRLGHAPLLQASKEHIAVHLDALMHALSALSGKDYPYAQSE